MLSLLAALVLAPQTISKPVIAFTVVHDWRKRGGAADIFVCDFDGKHIRKVSDKAFEPISPEDPYGPGGTGTLGLSPNGSWLFFTTPEDGAPSNSPTMCHLVNTNTKASSSITAKGKADYPIAWTTDSHLLISRLIGDYQDVIVDAKTGNVTQTVYEPDNSPDRRFRAAIRNETEMQGLDLVDTTTGDKTPLNDGAQGGTIAVWSPDSRYVIAHHNDAFFLVPTEHPDKMIPMKTGSTDVFYWTHDSRYVAWQDEHSPIKVLDAKTGKESVLSKQKGTIVGWTPDDGYLITGDFRTDDMPSTIYAISHQTGKAEVVVRKVGIWSISVAGTRFYDYSINSE